MDGTLIVTKSEDYLIKTVVEQLRYLRHEWNQNVELTSVIRNSNVLRMLLVDGNLVKAWRLCSYTYPIRLRAFTLSNIITEIGRDKILAAFTGGALHRGARFGLGVLTLAEDRDRKTGEENPHTEELTLDNYLKIPCMIIQGTDINRVELIKYVANKLGGTHIDFQRKENKPLEQKFVLLDGLHNYEQVDENVIPYQLLSVGQELVTSKHIQRLMKRDV